MAAVSCPRLVDDDDTTFLNQALLRRLAVTDQVLVAGNGQQTLDLLHPHWAVAASPKQMVELHGGKIWVESREQEGSTFHIELR